MKKAVIQDEAIKSLSDDEAEHPSVVSEQDPHNSDGSGENSELETGKVSSNLPQEGNDSLPEAEGAQREGTLELISLDSEEIVVLEQAAIKAQAAFRGYLVMISLI